MKKLRILLLFSGFILFFFRFNRITYYHGDEKEITGILMECIKKDTYTKLIVQAKEKIVINYYDEYNCNLGDRLKIKGTLSKIKNSQIFNLFDYQKYMLSKGISWQMKVEHIELIQKNNNLLYTIKNRIKERTNNNHYLSLFILGENTLDDEIKESYQNNGISHLFAISGMHVTLFMVVLTYLLEKITKHTIINKIIIIFFLLFYMVLTNFSISIVRASCLTIAFIIKKTFDIKLSSLELLGYICFFCLCYNPYLIYQVGFIFTFLITFTFLFFAKQLSKYQHYVTKLIATSLIAFIVSIPVLINHFFQINFLTPVLNLLFIPLITFIIFPCSILTFCFPIFLPFFEKLTMILENISLYCSQFQMFTFSFPKMPTVILFLYYLFMYVSIYYFFQKKWYILLLIPILLIHSHISIFRTSAIFTILDVGQGDSILIQLEHNKGNILIDTSGNNYQNQAENTLIPYFKSVGVKMIDYLILSHGDFDHAGEAIKLVENFKVENVILNCGEYNDLEKELIEALEKKNINYYSCIKELNIDKYKLQFLNTGIYDNENDNSSVIYLNYNNYKFLFMGDAGTIKEKDILEKYNISNIDVLKVGHHGSKTSSDKNFINEINPKYSIISVGKNNRYGHPNKEVLNNLNNSKIYRTDQDGSIIFKIKNNKLKIKTCSP